MKDPTMVAQKWSRNLQASGPSITAGVNAVTTAPSQLAIKQQDVMVQNFQAAVASGKWARNLGKVSLTDWQTAIIQVGIPRITAGAAKALPKMTDFMTQWLPYEAAGLAKLAQMPRGGLDQNIQRAVTMIRHNASFVRQ
jgi:hypothetical protein